MKRPLLLPLLLGFAFQLSTALAATDADKILTAYYTLVGKEIAANPKSLGMDGVLQKYDDLGKKMLLANKDVLHKKAVQDYLALPVLDTGTFDNSIA